MKRVVSCLISVLIMLSLNIASFAENDFVLTFSALHDPNVKMIQDVNYRLVKEVKYLGDENKAAETAVYFYNSNGDIKRILLSVDSVIKDSISFDYLYDKNRKVINAKKYYFDTIEEETEYSYNKTGDLQKISYYDYYQDGLTRVLKMEEYYDNDGKCIQRVDYSNGETYIYEYTYGKNGTLVEEKQIYPSTPYEIYYHYDSRGTKIELWNEGMGSDVWTGFGQELVKKDYNQDGFIEKIRIGYELDYGEYVGTYAYDNYYHDYESSGRIIEFREVTEGGYWDGDIKKDNFIYSEGGSFYRTRDGRIREIYNSNGNMIIQEGQYGDISEYNYNEEGNPVSLPDQFEYDQNGNVKTVKFGWSEETYGIIELLYEPIR